MLTLASCSKRDDAAIAEADQRLAEGIYQVYFDHKPELLAFQEDVSNAAAALDAMESDQRSEASTVLIRSTQAIPYIDAMSYTPLLDGDDLSRDIVEEDAWSRRIDDHVYDENLDSETAAILHSVEDHFSRYFESRYIIVYSRQYLVEPSITALTYDPGIQVSRACLYDRNENTVVAQLMTTRDPLAALEANRDDIIANNTGASPQEISALLRQLEEAEEKFKRRINSVEDLKRDAWRHHVSDITNWISWACDFESGLSFKDPEYYYLEGLRFGPTRNRRIVSVYQK